MDLNSSNQSDVERWNDEIAYILFPNTVIASCFLIIGLVGNSLVILVYRVSKNKLDTEDRYMIPVLAVCDLLASVVLSSFYIALNMRSVTFTNNELCKTLCFMNGFLTYLSILILFIIAVQRYLKICRPTGESKMTLFAMKLLILSSIIFTAVLASPIAFFYGSTEFPKEGTNLTGWKCKRRIDDNHEMEFKIYGSLLVLILIFLIIALLSIYLKIGQKLYIHFKKAKHAKNSLDMLKESTDEHVSFSADENNSANILDKMSTSTSLENMTAQAQSKYIKVSTVNKNEHIIRRLTVIFIVITVVFILCYVPRVTVLIAEGLIQNYWKRLSDGELSAIVFVHQIQLINNIVNPIVYAFLDRSFRQETSQLLKSLRQKCF